MTSTRARVLFTADNTSANTTAPWTRKQHKNQISTLSLAQIYCSMNQNGNCSQIMNFWNLATNDVLSEESQVSKLGFSSEQFRPKLVTRQLAVSGTFWECISINILNTNCLVLIKHQYLQLIGISEPYHYKALKSP